MWINKLALASDISSAPFPTVTWRIPSLILHSLVHISHGPPSPWDFAFQLVLLIAGRRAAINDVVTAHLDLVLSCPTLYYSWVEVRGYPHHQSKTTNPHYFPTFKLSLLPHVMWDSLTPAAALAVRASTTYVPPSEHCITVAAIMMALAWISVGLRITSRGLISRSIGWDDWTIMLTLVINFRRFHENRQQSLIASSFTDLLLCLRHCRHLHR